jgi:hypothetical protein
MERMGLLDHRGKQETTTTRMAAAVEDPVVTAEELSMVPEVADVVRL